MTQHANRPKSGPGRRDLVAAAITVRSSSPRSLRRTPPKTDTVVEGTIHVCSSCHGAGGQSISPTFPRLAANSTTTSSCSSRLFARSYTRRPSCPYVYVGHGGAAERCHDRRRRRYYASQKPVSGTPGDAALMAAGKKIFEEGVPTDEVPACLGLPRRSGPRSRRDTGASPASTRAISRTRSPTSPRRRAPTRSCTKPRRMTPRADRQVRALCQVALSPALSTGWPDPALSRGIRHSRTGLRFGRSLSRCRGCLPLRRRFHPEGAQCAAGDEVAAED